MTDDQKSNSLIAELKRRNVFKVAIAYILVAWVVLQIADVLFPALALPDWSIRLVAGFLVLGFPVALVLAWAYELTPDGLRPDGVEKKSTQGKHHTLDRAIIVLLLVALAGFAFERFAWNPSQSSTSDLPPLSNDPSIAVLAFKNTSPEPDQEYFADGLSEELLSSLARVKQLKVIGRTSSFRFKDQDIDAKAIGEQLSVSHLLEGSIRKHGDRLRVTANLLSTKDGQSLWTDTYDLTMGDVFSIQDSISRAVVRALRIELLGTESTPQKTPEQIQAYDLYLRALQQRNTPGQNNVQQALPLLEQALQLDDELAPAWQLMASIYGNMTLLGVIPPETGIEKVEQSTLKALAADPTLASAHATRGNTRMSFYWDWTGARSAYEKALRLDPSNSEARTGIAMLAVASGEVELAQQHITQAWRLDPLNLRVMHNRAFVFFLSDQPELAVDAFNDALSFAGGQYPIGHTMLALTLLSQGKVEQAYRTSEKEVNEQFRNMVQAPILFALGKQQEAEQRMTEIVEQYGDRAAVPISGAYAFMGQNDQAFEWLERAYRQKDANLAWTMVHPMNANLATDPRFDGFLEKLGLKKP